MNKKEKKFKKKYGFPVKDIYSLDSWLARELSKRIYAWLEVGVMSYPPNLTPEEWEKQLRACADGLHKYASDYPEGMKDGEVAMQWVADNFVGLWD